MGDEGWSGCWDVRIVDRQLEKASMILCSLEVRLVVVGSLEMAATILGLYPHQQSDTVIPPDVCHHLVEQVHPL